MSRLFLQNTPLAFFEREMMAKPGFGRRRIKETEAEDIIPPWEDTSRIADNPYEAYHFPVGDGCFVGTLVMKKWNRCDVLNCFFDGEDGRRYKLCVWNEYETGRAYCPVYTDIDISKLPLGTVLKAKYRETRSGKTKWLEAEILEEVA